MQSFCLLSAVFLQPILVSKDTTLTTYHSRMPGQTTMENLNWLNAQESLFPYRWSLYSAGHADIDITKDSPKEDMIRNRDTNSFLLGDSGGFQIAKGVWEGDWANPTCLSLIHI